jgi:hypothetical protein
MKLMITIIIIIMSTGRDYVSELRSQTGLLFIPQVIYEPGEPWWNDVDRGKHLVISPDLSGSHTSTVIWYQPGETGEGNDKFDLAKCVCVHTCK